MTLHQRTILSTLCGAGAGFFVWIVAGATGLLQSAVAVTNPNGFGNLPFVPALLLSLLIGTTLGIAIALVDIREAAYRWKSLGWGAGLGLAAGIVQPAIQWLLFAILPHGVVDNSAAPLAISVIMTGLSWAIGLSAIGAAQGAAVKSGVLIKQGMAGAFAGGFVGGSALSISQELFQYDPTITAIAEMFALILLGAITPYFSYLVPDLKKQAWVSVGGGSEFLITRPLTTLGSGRDCDIVIAGDSKVAAIHTVIEAIPETKRHRLRHTARNRPGATYSATRLNGEAITSEKWLVDGDSIVISGTKIEFREFATMREGAIRRAAVAKIMNEPGGDERIYDLPPSAKTAPGAPQPYRRAASPPLPAQRAKTKKRPPSLEIPAPPPPSTSPANRSSIGTRLVCITGPYRGQAFPLSNTATTVGRSMENTISLPADSSVSRTHARIVYEGNRHSISDAKSSHGTEVNAESIGSETRALYPGDIIGLGETLLRYE